MKGARPSPDPCVRPLEIPYFADAPSSEQCPCPIVPSLYDPRMPAKVVKLLFVAVPVFGQLSGVLPACEKNVSDDAMAAVTAATRPALLRARRAVAPNVSLRDKLDCVLNWDSVGGEVNGHFGHSPIAVGAPVRPWQLNTPRHIHGTKDRAQKRHHTTLIREFDAP